MNGTKKWYKSKTLWFNIITTAVLFAQVVQEFIDPAYSKWIVMFMGGGNIILRVWFSNKALTL